jgi:large conductance mechanosensitive channel
LLRHERRDYQEKPMKVPTPVASLWQEFKAFAFKGNMIELAVAVVIGAAFGRVINAVVSDIIMPIINIITPRFPYQNWHIWFFPIGHLIGELLNFIIVAFAVFISVVKLTQLVMKRAGGTPAPSEPITKECMYCLSVIPIKARKCAHCTADLPPADAAPVAPAIA